MTTMRCDGTDGNLSNPANWIALHTIGEWYIIEGADYLNSREFDAVVVDNNDERMYIVKPGGIGGRTTKEMSANGRLIAAAPDLLDALIRLVSCVTDREAIRAGIKAINKAKGTP